MRLILNAMKQNTMKEADGFSLCDAQRARSYHGNLPGYAETPLLSLKRLASELGAGDIYIKDESGRFGIGSFKALGASYAAGRELSALLLGRDADFTALTAAELREVMKTVLLVTATDGNHGCAVAWTARSLGCRARVFLPAGSAEERLERIRSYGAEAEITGCGYDDAVRLAAGTAEAEGGILLQDTAWEGYTDIPKEIMQGYLTMALEVCERLPKAPTHILLQAGVGSMAAAMAAFFTGVYGERAPRILIVEPEGAACLFRSALHGERRCCEGELHTMMAGLSCGEPSTLAWELLKDRAYAFLAIEDEAAAEAMKRLAFPPEGEPAVEAGESGAAGVAALLTIARDAALKEALGIGRESVILCFNTECATDRKNYNRIVYGKNND